METKAFGERYGLAEVKRLGMLSDIIGRSKVDNNSSAENSMRTVLLYLTLGHRSWNVSFAQSLSSFHSRRKLTESSTPVSSATLVNNFAKKDSSAFEPDLTVQDGERVPHDKFRSICSAIDKLDKLPWDQVRKEMIEEKGLTDETTDKLGGLVQKRVNVKVDISGCLLLFPM